MLDVDYERGLTQLRDLVQRWKPELLAEFSVFEVRLRENLVYERLYGESSNKTAERNEVLYRLIEFTNKHFSLQFIDLCRSGDVRDVAVAESTVRAPAVNLSEALWQGGGEVHVLGRRYILSVPDEAKWASDQSVLLQQAMALEEETNRQVRLRQVLLRRATAQAEAWKTALEKESRLLLLLEERPRPGFPRHLAFEETAHTVTLVQSAARGQSWWQLFHSSDKALDMRQTQSLLHSARALCAILRTLHAQHMAHRALSPEKIFLLDGRQTLLQDPGLATWKNESGEGTALYRAPEQAIRGRVRPGPSTDIYQLAMILYHLITGKPPQPLQQVLPLQIYNTGLPTELDTALQRAIAPNSKERWRTIAEFSAALREVPF